MRNHEEDPGRFLIERKGVPDMGNHVELNSIYKRKRVGRVLVNRHVSDDSPTWEIVKGSGTENWMQIWNSGSEDEFEMSAVPQNGKPRRGRDGKADKLAYKSQGFERNGQP